MPAAGKTIELQWVDGVVAVETRWFTIGAGYRRPVAVDGIRIRDHAFTVRMVAMALVVLARLTKGMR